MGIAVEPGLGEILEAVAEAAAAMLGQRLVTKQTGAAGLPIHQVYVEAGSAIAREIYLSVLLNRDRGRIAFVASAAGATVTMKPQGWLRLVAPRAI